MMLRPALLVVLFLVGSAGSALALERTCPRGQVWNRSVGACVKKPKVKKLSPEEKHFQALEIVNGLGEPGSKGTLDDAVRLFDEACRADFGPSCHALGFVRATLGDNTASNTEALGLYAKACALGELDGCLGEADLHVRSLDYASALPIWRRACEAGSGRACFEAAEALRQGTAGDPSPDEAEFLYTRAHTLLAPECPASSRSCLSLGILLARGLGVAADAAAAFRAFDLGCDGGAGEACLQVAMGHDYGHGTPQNKRLAIAAYERTCTVYDNASACHDLALTILETPDPDQGAALAAAQRACEMEEQLCGLLGQFRARGVGGPVDDVAATGHYRQACDAGRPSACLTLGERLIDSDAPAAAVAFERACRGTEPAGCGRAAEALGSGGRAFLLAERGCERGHGPSCHVAGGLLYEGKDGGTRPDMRRSLVYFDAGCAAGTPVSCDMAGDIRRDGRGVDVDKPGALEKYRIGCEGTETLLAPLACESYGRLAWAGDGVPRDLPTAATALVRACRYGVAAACEDVPAVAAEAAVDDDTRAEWGAELGKTCDEDGGVACMALGDALASGDALGPAAARAAFARWSRACDGGLPSGCVRVAYAYAEGIGVVADAARADARYRELCDAGAPRACNGLGVVLVRAGQLEAAAAVFRQSCEDGDGASCTSLGFSHYTRRGAPWDVPAAAKLYEQACELGDAAGCFNLGELYEHGIGVTADDARAVQYYERGCSPAAPSACGRLGRYWARGAGGLTKDVARAETELRRACDAGAAEACHELAELLAAAGGQGSEVARLRQAALDRAEADATTNPYGAYVLGRLHLVGSGVAADPVRAAEWFGKACDGFDPLGCLEAGRLLARGARGLPADRARADAYLQRACGAGLGAACEGAATAPGTVAAKGSGCACQAGANAGDTAPWLLLAACWTWRRRRRALHAS